MRSEGRTGTARDHRACRHAVAARWQAIYQVSGVSDTEIRWDLTTHVPICLDRLILPRRQPEFDPWEIQADRDDLSEMFEIL